MGKLRRSAQEIKMQEIRVEKRELKSPTRMGGIELHNETIIDLYIDRCASFSDFAVCWPELIRSCSGNGLYGIFTCYCGIPGCAGAERIEVRHRMRTVNWIMTFPWGRDRYCFEKRQYIDTIKACGASLNLEAYPLAVEEFLDFGVS